MATLPHIFAWRITFQLLQWKTCLVKMPKTVGFYAVKFGRIPGVYNSWDDCLEQTRGFSGARYKKFLTLEEAEAFVDNSGNPLTSSKGAKPDSSSSSSAAASSKHSSKSSSGSDSVRSGDLSSSDSTHLKFLSDNLKVSVSSLNQQLADFSHAVKTLQVSKSGTTAAFLQSIENAVTEARTKFRTFESSVVKSRDLITKIVGGSTQKRAASPTEDESQAKKSRKEDSKDGVPSESTATVYTDGCCHNNGKSTPKAGLGVYWGPGSSHNLAERLEGRQTNNRAEIHAARRAIEQAKDLNYKKIIVYTDSQFLISCITQWIHKWKKNGWKLTNGNKVINRKDLTRLEESMLGIKVEWQHVKAHVGIAGNEAADKLANEGARLAPVKDENEDSD